MIDLRKIRFEYLGSILILISVTLLFSYSIYTLDKSIKTALILALFSGITGSFLIPFGFWGADFAFGIAIKHIDQRNERGKIQGIKNRVYVPFIKNYTPLEWWNISWFTTVIGLILTILSVFVFGYVLGTIS